ncbi:MAG TPA: sulfate permease [Candidatus Kapabacteria bacterium]|nr:sulfate permease [Candidatus Kapabacteria bacterium]
MFRPKLLTTLRDYSRGQFLRDIGAGVIVGIVALPLAIAFAIASGVSPEKGLITAVIAGFLISALGGSRVQIGGPTGAFVVIIYGIVRQYGEGGLAIATIMAGILLVIMGVARLGALIKFIPHPVIVGFTSGIAVVIFSSQIKDFLGLQMGPVPSEFFDKWREYVLHLSTINPEALAVAAGSLLIIVFWPRISRRVPAPLIALLAATAVVQLFSLHVETIGSRFGAIPSSIPTPSIPQIDLATIKTLFGPALTIALLAAIESLLSAVVADGMIGGKHRSNTELIAQGIANMASPLFGGIPATGAIARTATNIRNGGRTPVAGIVHAVVLLLFMLLLGRWATLIPLPCLAAILVVVAYNMSEWRSFRAMIRSPLSDAVVFVLTFVLTVAIDLTVAIEVGMVLSILLFMRRMAMVTNVGVITRELNDEDGDDEAQAVAALQMPGVEIYEINGPLFFGAAYKFAEAMNVVESGPTVRVIRMRNVPALDATGLHALRDAWEQLRKRGGQLVLAEIHAQPLTALEKAGLDVEIGSENVHGTLEGALARAATLTGGGGSGRK